MAPARPYWKGIPQTRLGCVSDCGLPRHVIHERVSFRQVNKKTGNRLRQQLVDEVTREPVGSEDKGRGYEYSKGAYLLVEDEELDAFRLRAATQSKSIRSFHENR